jgi:hypothetical protein
MEALSINGLVMPTDFPRDLYEAVQNKLNRFQKQYGHDYFIGAWSAISYRYHAVVDHDDDFTASLIKHGPGPGQPLRYHQERNLFGFFSNGVSVLDAYCFAMFAVGAILIPSNFSLVDEWKIDWKFTSIAYKSSFPGDPMPAVLDKLWVDPAYVDLREIRNVLTHRGVPPRHHSLPIGSDAKPTAILGRVNIALDKETTSSRRQQVVRLLSTALEAALSFVEAHC